MLIIYSPCLIMTVERQMNVNVLDAQVTVHRDKFL